MTSSSQRHHGVDVRNAQQNGELIRSHAAFEAMTDAGATQVTCREPFHEAERGAPPCELRVQGAAVERMSPFGYEQKSFWIETYTIEMAVEDELGLAGEGDGPGERCSSPPSFESHPRLGLSPLDMSSTELEYLRDETSRSIEQRKRCIDSDLSRIVRFGIDEPHAIHGAWKSLHSRGDLRYVVVRYSSGVRHERHLAFLATGPPPRDGCGRIRNPPKIRPHPG